MLPVREGLSVDFKDMIAAAEAAMKHRKPGSNDARAEYAEDLTGDLETVKSTLEDLAEMVDELLSAIEEVAAAETLAEMRDGALVEDVRERAEALRDCLRDGT